MAFLTVILIDVFPKVVNISDIKPSVIDTYRK